MASNKKVTKAFFQSFFASLFVIAFFVFIEKSGIPSKFELYKVAKTWRQIFDEISKFLAIGLTSQIAIFLAIIFNSEGVPATGAHEKQNFEILICAECKGSFSKTKTSKNICPTCHGNLTEKPNH